MELNKILERVRKLIERAEAPISDGATPEQRAAEQIQQETARAMADALMLQYAVSQATLDAAAPAGQRSKPDKIEIHLTGDFELVAYVGDLASALARHCRCQVRLYTPSYREGTYWATVYGFQSDLKYFEIMYTTLRLHMIGALSAKPDLNKSLAENAYQLHNAGLNWFDIAQAYGWREVTPEPGESKSGMYVHRDTHERAPWSQVVGVHKNAYNKLIKERGETALRIPPGGMKAFRRSAAWGYSSRLNQRLADTRKNRQAGAEVVLASRGDELDLFYKEQNPDLFREREPAEACEACNKAKSGHCRQHPKGRSYYAPYSQAGYAAGVRHANTAEINPSASSGSGPAPAQIG